MIYTELVVYTVDTQEEADKVHELGYGKEEISIDEDSIQDLKSGKIIVWSDGEYTHQIKYKKDESNE